MTYRVTTTRQFDRDVALLVKRGADLGKLYEAVGLLAQGGRLPAKYRDHALRGDQKGFRDCHIAPDWVLLYLRLEQKLVLVLTRTGSHSDLLE